MTAVVGYNYFHTVYPNINLLNMEQVNEQYIPIMKCGIYDEYIPLIQYMFNHTKSEEHKVDDQELILSVLHNTDMLRLFLQRDIDPTAENNRILINAIETNLI